MMDGAGDTPRPLDFDPAAPLDWAPTWHHQVTSYPWAENEPRGFRRAAGMFAADGTHIPESHCWRYADDTVTVVPDRDDSGGPHEHISGRWLFAGMYYAHFGHFLVESTARLYALADHSDIDGIFFYPKMRKTHEFKPLQQYKPVFQHLGLDGVQIRLPQKPVTIEQIAFPPPAFGIGEMSAGRPEYRAFMRERLSRNTPPEGAEKIYITRSGLNSRRGRILMETHLEALLAAEGYRIIYPELMDISEQVAQYRAARRIVSLDGSALHLAAMVVDPETQIAIVNRGPSENIDDYMRQFRTFANIDPTRIEAIKGFWHPAGQRVVKREVQADLEFPKAALQLAVSGFIEHPELWDNPPQADLDARLDVLRTTFDADPVYREVR